VVEKLEKNSFSPALNLFYVLYVTQYFDSELEKNKPLLMNG
jgi:hypothetical protein